MARRPMRITDWGAPACPPDRCLAWPALPGLEIPQGSGRPPATGSGRRDWIPPAGWSTSPVTTTLALAGLQWASAGASHPPGSASPRPPAPCQRGWPRRLLAIDQFAERLTRQPPGLLLALFMPCSIWSEPLGSPLPAGRAAAGTSPHQRQGFGQLVRQTADGDEVVVLGAGDADAGAEFLQPSLSSASERRVVPAPAWRR